MFKFLRNNFRIGIFLILKDLIGFLHDYFKFLRKNLKICSNLYFGFLGCGVAAKSR